MSFSSPARGAGFGGAIQCPSYSHYRAPQGQFGPETDGWLAAGEYPDGSPRGGGSLMQTNTFLLWAAILVALLLLTRTLFSKREAFPMDQIMELKMNGALVLDVRSAREFAQEHAPGSLNIPLKHLQERLSELDRTKPILVCCASGARSAIAAQMLQQAGFQRVHDAGSWSILR